MKCPHVFSEFLKESFFFSLSPFPKKEKNFSFPFLLSLEIFSLHTNLIRFWRNLSTLSTKLTIPIDMAEGERIASQDPGTVYPWVTFTRIHNFQTLPSLLHSVTNLISYKSIATPTHTCFTNFRNVLYTLRFI